MANFGQATFVGSEVVIECGEKMNCCQREQAQAKVENYNREIGSGGDRAFPDEEDRDLSGPLQIAPSVSDITSIKENAQSRARNKLVREMEAAPDADARREVAKAHSTSPCLGDQIADDWEAGDRSFSELNVQADHPVEAKWGGPADIDVLPALDATVNGFFGSVAKNMGKKMLEADPPIEEIGGVSLICTPPCSPPHAGAEQNDYSTGSTGEFPSPAPNPVTKYKAD